MNFELTPQKLFALLLGALEKGNHERCLRIFYDVAKIVHYKQERLNKPQLKMKEITSALLLVDFYHTSMYRFQASGGLACNFGEFPEGKLDMFVPVPICQVSAFTRHWYGKQSHRHGLQF